MRTESTAHKVVYDFVSKRLVAQSILNLGSTKTVKSE